MKSSLKLLGAAALGAAGVTAAALATASGSQGDPVYWIFYYSDATYTTQVGSIEEFCDSWGVGQGPLVGQATAFEDRLLLG